MKKVFSLICSLYLMLSLGITVLASNDAYVGLNSAMSAEISVDIEPDGFAASTPDSVERTVIDDANLFTDAQENSLFEKAMKIKETYSVDIVLHTTNSIGTKSVSKYADDYYDYNGYGVGAERSGLIFMVNMNNGEEGNRDYYTSTRGSVINALTDYAIYDSNSAINSQVLPFLSQGEYYKAFDRYLDLVDIFLEQAATGEPYDINNSYSSTSDYLFTEVVIIVIALIIAFFITKSMKSKMNTAKVKFEASDYVKQGSMVVTGSADIFAYRNISSVPIPKNTSSGSGGSSTHTSSSGASHGGGGGKF